MIQNELKWERVELMFIVLNRTKENHQLCDRCIILSHIHDLKCKSGKRKESIIEQEIRLQKQREEEIHAERQRISRHKTTPTSRSILAGDQPDLPQIQSTPKTLKAINGGVSDQLDSATKSMEKVAITENPE